MMSGMDIVRSGPRRSAEWPAEMKRVRDSAFGYPPLTAWERLSRRRRFVAESGRYPHMLTRRDCWIVRAENDDTLVGYAWAYLIAPPERMVYIDDVAVSIDWQGKGVGRALIDELVAWLAEDGVTEIKGLPTDPRMERIFRHHRISPGN